MEPDEKEQVNSLILDLNNMDIDKKKNAIQKIKKILKSVSKERIKSELLPYILSKHIFNLNFQIALILKMMIH